jgi:hypothetical protein
MTRIFISYLGMRIMAQKPDLIYARLQASWDKRDLDDIRQFTSPEVCTEIEHQAQKDPTPGQTDLLLINPRIL